MNILVVAAHPDDEVLGCGGVVAKRSGAGEVRFAILGEGISSRHAQRAQASRDDLQSLQADARRAAAVLGVRSVDFGELPDNRFDERALLDVVKQIEQWIEHYRPNAIYTHHQGDLNIDHGIVFRAVLIATRPGASTHTVGDIMAFEVPSSSEWSFGQVDRSFQPNVFVDISETVERKIEAMQCYRSESRPSPHPRSPEKIRALAAYRGSAGAMPFAEAFELIRSIRR